MTQRVILRLAWRPPALTPAAVAACAAVLSPDERERAARFTHEDGARRFTWTRGTQRLHLGAHLGADPASLRFVQDGDGKPHLAPPFDQCEYNASHAGELFALAISDRPVGLDVERARAVPGRDRIMRRVFGAAIATEIARLPEPEQDAAFFAEWTRLEAHAKLHGHGLWRLLAERERHAASEDVRYASLALPPSYYGAVAVARADVALIAGDP